MLEDINDKKANAGQVITVIDILCEKMKDDYRIEMQFEKVLVTFIASALIMCDITDEQRNKLVEEWIKRVKKIFSNQSYVAEVNMVIVLWEQLNKNINNDLKKQILIMILESIVNDEKSGLISQLAELTYYFLGKNRNYASRVFNTIIMLAEDEMNHQKFNAVYIKNHNDAEYEFIPNMVPKLRGVDYWIRENKGNEYQNKRSEIIQEYLYDGKGGDLSEFDISNYDIDLLCNIACCGLDTEDGVDVRTINEHIKKIYSDSELEEDSTIRNFRIVQTEGPRQVTRDTKHYNLQMIIAVGFKVNNERAVQFRKWANGIVKDYAIKG